MNRLIGNPDNNRRQLWMTYRSSLPYTKKMVSAWPRSSLIYYLLPSEIGADRRFKYAASSPRRAKTKCYWCSDDGYPAPIMNPFLLRYPLLRVEIMVDDRLGDATSAGCDAGIRYGEQLAKDNIAVPIGPRPQTLALAAAPSYLALQGLPSHPADLAEHDCIRLKYSSGALIPLQFGWQGKIVSVNPAGRLIIGVNGAAAAIEFARQGSGIIATFEN